MSLRFPGQHKWVLIDTRVWIYHFEQHPVFAAAAGRVVESLEADKFRGIASELTLLELTVRPLQLGRQDVADDYEVLLGYFPNLELQPVSREILLEAELKTVSGGNLNRVRRSQPMTGAQTVA